MSETSRNDKKNCIPEDSTRLKVPTESDKSDRKKSQKKKDEKNMFI